MKRLEVPVPKPLEGHPLQDPAEPNLLPQIFPPGQPPRVAFDGRTVPLAPPMDVWTVDATFRGTPFSAEASAEIHGLLHRLCGPRGVIRQTELPFSSERDREILTRCLGRKHEFPEITGWGLGSADDLPLLKEYALKECGLALPVSDFAVFGEYRRTRKEALRGYAERVDLLLENGIVARCHLEDVTRADLYGFAVPLARDLMKRSRQAEVPVKIRLVDTLGVAVLHPGAAPPRSVQRLVHAMLEEAEVPAEWLEWEGRGASAVASASAAWMAGCCTCVGSFLHSGAAAPAWMPHLLDEYVGLKGDPCGLHLEACRDILPKLAPALHA